MCLKITEKNNRREDRLPEAVKQWYEERKTKKAWTNYVLLQAAENLANKGDATVAYPSYKPAQEALTALTQDGRAIRHRENLSTFWRIL